MALSATALAGGCTPLLGRAAKRPVHSLPVSRLGFIKLGGAPCSPLTLLPPLCVSSLPSPPSEELSRAREQSTTMTANAQQPQQQQQQADAPQQPSAAVIERRQRRQREQQYYKLAAVAASLMVSGLAILATYLRFYWHLRDAGEMPWGELTATIALVAGGVFGMEMWARYAHKSLWHDLPSGWALHKSHHEPRTGPFEANDIFAIINGVPAMALCAYGFLTPNMTGGLCFGAGLGITLFGIMYMFVHDGLVHRRFPVGPIAELPALKRIAVAHQIHHGGKFDGAPWGLFLAVQELDAIPGARAELERLVQQSEQAKAATERQQ
ncbi:beta carotene hydroxylase [Dunaliella salina]|uniref:beta-carotene 3-hydroxylase n=1 Tax=Dunaliella salina TaxID=3046 RepID=A0ABQ7GFQ5_DUNSA|nr:beta carotene hydroxylase [Dunaliella salina]|eukprot:KAF5833419.1 beta carotene hydroxylase [Dunaliella salina]